jgi:branched-chain amino acid transport system ATP-binding protein
MRPDANALRGTNAPLVLAARALQTTVADLADRIFVLDYGKPLAEGTPEQVLNDPRVIAAYLGQAT